jgi:uncharacterized protein (DUF983 family)
MSNCPHCGNPIGRYRRLLTPARICCPVCGGLSRVQTAPKVQLGAALVLVPTFVLFVWAAHNNYTSLFWLLFVLLFVVGFTSQAAGRLVPRQEVTLAVVSREIRGIKWSRGFLVTLLLAAVLAVLLVVYANA